VNITVDFRIFILEYFGNSKEQEGLTGSDKMQQLAKEISEDFLYGYCA
jgi:hypothetical protein